jgi:hypothetical protein
MALETREVMGTLMEKWRHLVHDIGVGIDIGHGYATLDYAPPLALRLAKTAKDIESDSEIASTGARFDLAPAVLIGLLGASLLLYMSHAVLRTL